MKKNKAVSEENKKMGKIRRFVTLVSGSVMLYKAVKNKNFKKGAGAGLLILKGVRG